MADAIKLLNDSTFKMAFIRNENAIGLFLRINDKLNENETNKVRAISFDAQGFRNVLIALESNTDGKLIVFWKTKQMDAFLSTKLEKIQTDEKSFMLVPVDIVIDSFLLSSIKNGHNCKFY
jgi:hypothetical protein